MSFDMWQGQNRMQILIQEFISLDGVVQAPGGAQEDTDDGFRHGGWSAPYFDVDGMGRVIDEVLQASDAIIQGRRTYQVMAGAWPDRAGDPFADRMNSLQKYVVTDTLSEDDVTTWSPTTIIRNADLVAKVTELRHQPGDGYLNVMGTPTVARTLLSADLVDELFLMIEPITLGGGKRIFPDDGEARPFELTSSIDAGTGVQVCRYRRAR
jgi:dihydrofolate reductase